MTFDELRTAHPGLGFAVYAYAPDDGVTLSVMEAGEVFEFHGATFVDAVNAAFPQHAPHMASYGWKTLTVELPTEQQPSVFD